MERLDAVDAVEVLVLVDNVTDSLSSVPDYVETEFRLHWRRGLHVLGGTCLCCAAHGLSCLITARRDATSTEDGEGWEPDPLIMDERFVAVNLASKGLIVFTACSHAGVVNALRHARECFPDVPLHAVVGGFHLSGPNERTIPQTVEAMREFDLACVAAAHCTGWRAVGALATAFGRAVVPASVGKRYTF